MIDSATHFDAFRRVLLPLAAPDVLAVALYAFTPTWNEFLYVLVFITKVRPRRLNPWSRSYGRRIGKGTSG